MSEHYVAIRGIDHLTEVSPGPNGEQRWECWCTNPCCNKVIDDGPKMFICICEDCSCRAVYGI